MYLFAVSLAKKQKTKFMETHLAKNCGWKSYYYYLVQIIVGQREWQV